jgi:hypothetical protein
MLAAPSPRARKPPNLWAVASVTYGLVIVVTILSILTYYYLVPKRTDPLFGDSVRSMAVGSVWIPVYPGAMVEGTVSAKQDKATESTLKFGTKDRTDRVLSFYEAALKKGVFRFETVTKNPDGGTIQSIVHQGKTTVVVNIHATGEGSQGEIRTIDRDPGDKDTRN